MKRFFVLITAVITVITAIHSAFAATPPEGAKVVYPEVATRVLLSNTDTNRFVCSERVRDVVFSKEKGVRVRYTGKDAYVKFVIELKFGEKQYVTSPTELFVICGETTYNIIADPTKSLPAQTIYLSSGRQENIKKNLAMFAGMPYEDKLQEIVNKIYTGAIPDSFSISNVNKTYPMFKDVLVKLVKIVDITGEGLQVKEYHITLADGNYTGVLDIKEKNFVLKELLQNPAAMQLDEFKLTSGKIARLLVVERTEENGGI